MEDLVEAELESWCNLCRPIISIVFLRALLARNSTTNVLNCIASESVIHDTTLEDELNCASWCNLNVQNLIYISVKSYSGVLIEAMPPNHIIHAAIRRLVALESQSIALSTCMLNPWYIVAPLPARPTVNHATSQVRHTPKTIDLQHPLLQSL